MESLNISNYMYIYTYYVGFNQGFILNIKSLYPYIHKQY